MIELKNIKVSFNKGTNIENYVLQNVSLVVHQSQFITIIGGNGAGKSTLMNIISGAISPDQGQVLIDGKDVTKVAPTGRAAYVARVFQDPLSGTFDKFTIEENMAIAFKRGKKRLFCASSNNKKRAFFKESLSELNLGLENRLNDQVGSLSGGQRQALSLIMAIQQDLKILILDEHTSALDPKVAKSIMDVTNKIISNHKLTTLMITHSMSQALEYGDRTIMLYKGKIIKDLTMEDKLKLSPNDLIRYFDL